jgi:hypothetical protein
MRVAKGQLQSGQIRIMFRKLKVDLERTNADLSAELDLMRLQSIVRRRSFCLSLRYGLEDLHCRHHPGRHVRRRRTTLFGVAHSVSRFATALKTCTVATIQGDMFKPVPKTEVGTFRPVARAGSTNHLTVFPSQSVSSLQSEDTHPWYFLLLLTLSFHPLQDVPEAS